MDVLALVSTVGTVAGVVIALAAWLWPRTPIPWQDPVIGAVVSTSAPPPLPEGQQARTVLTADRNRLKIFGGTMFVLFPGFWIVLYGAFTIFLVTADSPRLVSGFAAALTFAILSYTVVKLILLITQPLDVTFDRYGIVLRMSGSTWAFHWDIIRHAAVRSHWLIPTLVLWLTLPKGGGIVGAEANVLRFPGYPGYCSRLKAVTLVPAIILIGGAGRITEAIRHHAKFNTTTPMHSEADEKLKRTLQTFVWVLIIVILAIFIIVVLNQEFERQRCDPYYGLC